MSDWVVEAALQFVRQPLWTTPVQNFIDSNCACFDNEEELKLEYTSIHKKFQDLIEGIMESMLAELGVGPEILVEACEAQKDKDPNIKKFLQYLYSLDDFRSFRAIMMKRNVELEQEAMTAWAKMQEYHAQQQLNGSGKETEGAGSGGSSSFEEVPTATEDDEDAKQLELALKASLQGDEMIMKAAEVEDADLQAALALSAAEENERIRREEEAGRAKADADKKASDEKTAKEAATDAAASAAQKKTAEEEHQKAEAEVAKKKADAEAAMQAKEEAVLKERKEKLAVAVAAAEKSREQEKIKNPDAPMREPVATSAPAPPAPAPVSATTTTAPAVTPAPAVLRTSLTEVSDKPKPSGLGEIQTHRATGGFGKYGALPTLQPSFATLAREANPTPAVNKVVPSASTVAGAKSAEEKAAQEAQQKAEIEARAKYMAEQRRKLIEAKKQQRDGDLSAFCQANKLTTTPEAHNPTATIISGSSSSPAVSKEEAEHRDMSRALMRRFKDDLIQESSKPVKQ